VFVVKALAVHFNFVCQAIIVEVDLGITNVLARSVPRYENAAMSALDTTYRLAMSSTRLRGIFPAATAARSRSPSVVSV